MSTVMIKSYTMTAHIYCSIYVYFDCHDKVLHYDSTYLLFNIRVCRLSWRSLALWQHIFIVQYTCISTVMIKSYTMTAHIYRSIYVCVDCHDKVLHYESTLLSFSLRVCRLSWRSLTLWKHIIIVQYTCISTVLIKSYTMKAHNYRSIYVYVDCHDKVLHYDST